MAIIAPAPARPAAPKPSRSSQSTLPNFEGPKLKDYLPYMKPATFGKGAGEGQSSGSSTPDEPASLPDQSMPSMVGAATPHSKDGEQMTPVSSGEDRKLHIPQVRISF